MSKVILKPAETFIERLVCDCGGEMLPIGTVYFTDPPQYPHKCEKCGCVETGLNETYPKQTVREV